MQRRVLLTAAVLMLCAGVRSLGADVTIRGRVVDSDRKGLAWAAIELWSWLGSFDDESRVAEGDGRGERVAVAKSDGGGYFELTTPAGGSYLLEVSAGERLPMDIWLAHLFDDVELRTLQLASASVLEVRVVNAGGEPLADAWVKPVSGVRTDGEWRPAIRRAQTGEDGTVTMRVAASKVGLVGAFAPRFVPARSRPPGSGAVTLELARGVARTIEVREANGRPAAGALVRVGDDGWPAGSADGDGRFVVYSPPDGGLRVTVETTGGGWARRLIGAPDDGEIDPMTIELERPTVIAGQVSDASTDQPLAGARVWLGADPGRFADTSRDGRYEISFPAFRQRYAQPRAAASGYLRESGSDRHGPAVARRNLALHPMVPLVGRVSDGRGDAIEGAEITASVAQSFSAASLTRSRVDGRFRLPAARDVLYHLAVSKSGYRTVRTEAAATASGLEIVLRRGLPGTGVVVDADGQPVPGAEVRLGVPASFSSAAKIHHRATTDEEGRFEFNGLVPGKLDLWATAPGYAKAVVRGAGTVVDGSETVPEDRVVDFGTMVLEPGVRLAGRVEDSEGLGLADAIVRWLPSTSGFPGGSYGVSHLPGVTSDAAGQFVIEDLSQSEKLSLQARLHGYSWDQLTGVEAPGEPVVLVLEAKARVRGMVVDRLGEPVPDAMVSIMSESAAGGGHGTGRQCDSAGRFEFEVDATDKLKLSARSAGLRSTETRFEVAPGEVVEDLRLVLEPGATVEAQILGPAGEPIVGAGIMASGGGLGWPKDAVTDDDGYVQIAGLETGLVTLQVSAEGFPPADRRIDVQPGINSVEIRLLEAHEVRGRVVDEALRPIAGVQVRLSSAGGHGEAVSSADGGFIASVPDGRYRLRAWKQGFARADLDEAIEVAGVGVDGVEIRLSEGAAVTGRVLGLDPDRLTDVLVATRPAGGASRVDREGRYRIENLLPGEWSVVATERGSGRDTRGRTVLEAGQREAVLDLEFTPGLTLTGRVVIDREPAPKTIIEVHWLDMPPSDHHPHIGALQRVEVTDYRGHFRFADLAPGRYLVVAQQAEAIRRRELDLTNDAGLEIEIVTHGLNGQVSNVTTGEALEGAWVVLEPANGEISPAAGPPRFESDSRGQFRFARVAEGSYRLRVELAGYATLMHPITIEPGAVLEGLDLRLTPTEGLTLQVQLASGSGASVPRRVGVSAYGARSELVLNGEFTATEGGMVRLSSLPAGSWLLLVAARRSGVVRVAVEAPGDPVPVLLPAGTQLEARVSELAGSSESATLTVTDVNGQPFLAMYSRSPQPVSQWAVHDGRATVHGLPPGQWNLMVTTAEGRSWNASVVATANGGTVLADIE